MLNRNNISDIEMFTEEWDTFRLGKFTSSRIAAFMTLKPLSAGAYNYIHQKVGEVITGKCVADEEESLDDENTSWGKKYESEALEAFKKEKGIEFITTQKIIHVPGTNFSSTPDGIWEIYSSLTQENCINVSTIEVKCPRKYPRFIPLYNCNTPEDLKSYSTKYYWQVLDQMDNSDAAIGYFGTFHPFFTPGKNMKIIQFNKLDLWDDFKLLKERKNSAYEVFKQVLSEFT